MLSDDSDVEDIQNITINEHYAKAFEYRKEREELAKRALQFMVLRISISTAPKSKKNTAQI